MTARTLPPWHVRRQRPDARTTVVYFIDVDANRMTFAQFFDELESNEEFRTLFSAELAASTEKPFTWETPSLTKTTIVREFECALVEATLPPKLKADPSKLAAHFGPEDSVAVFPSPEGDATIVAPAPKHVTGWYAHLSVFLKRVPAPQIHALWQTLARTAKAQISAKPIWLSATPPSAWLQLRIDTTPKSAKYKPYGGAK